MFLLFFCLTNAFLLAPAKMTLQVKMRLGTDFYLIEMFSFQPNSIHLYQCHRGLPNFAYWKYLLVIKLKCNKSGI